ncbi:MAG TPA: protein-disulfide reductase DsbD domain-containing protein [Terracidiphilus sp.]|nr:protein-disulfide reductase DsbD domain-containing protein [Terracidiphilus sp.]
MKAKMKGTNWKTAISLALLLRVTVLPLYGQSSMADSPDRSILKGAAVEYLFPEQVNVTAGQPSAVEMHFRVGEGLHVNSHTPSQDFLIPTTLSFPESSGVRLEAATYPEGEEFALPVDPTTRLSVYTGEFTIHTSIVATRGNHLVEAKLHYQACDKEACFPPKTITVPIDVIGK